MKVAFIIKQYLYLWAHACIVLNSVVDNFVLMYVLHLSIVILSDISNALKLLSTIIYTYYGISQNISGKFKQTSTVSYLT